MPRRGLRPNGWLLPSPRFSRLPRQHVRTRHMNARVYRPCLYKIDHSLFRFCATRMSGRFVSRRIARPVNRN
jgi:hypothetical protein